MNEFWKGPTILSIKYIRWTSQFAGKIGTPKNISAATHPADQMSALHEKGISSTTSGAR